VPCKLRKGNATAALKASYQNCDDKNGKEKASGICAFHYVHQGLALSLIDNAAAPWTAGYRTVLLPELVIVGALKCDTALNQLKSFVIDCRFLTH